jgi:hypothetical protein
MGFLSKSQLRACFALQSKMEKAGKKSTWDCHKFYHEGKTPFKDLPDYKYENDTIHIGPRNGRYVIRNSRKIYIQKKNAKSR